MTAVDYILSMSSKPIDDDLITKIFNSSIIQKLVDKANGNPYMLTSDDISDVIKSILTFKENFPPDDT